MILIMDFQKYVETVIIVNEFSGCSNKIKIGKINDQYVASKFVHDEKTRLNEISILKKLNHSNIVKYLYESNGEFYMTGIRYGLTLHDYFIRRNDNIDLKSCIDILYQISDALSYIHSLNIIHHDVKDKNILFDFSNNKILICDFGLAEIADENGQGDIATKSFGTWIAPEQTNNITPITNKIDVYCFGILSNEIFIKGRTSQDYFKICDGIVAKIAFLCQENNPDDRPTMDQIKFMYEKIRKFK